MGILVFGFLFINLCCCFGGSADTSNNLAEMLMIRQDDKLNTIVVKTQDLINTLKTQSERIMTESSSNLNTLTELVAQFVEQSNKNNLNSQYVLQNATVDLTKKIDKMHFKLDDTNSTSMVQNAIKSILEKTVESENMIKDTLNELQNNMDNKFDELHVANRKIENLLEQVQEENTKIQSNLTGMVESVDALLKESGISCQTPWILLNSECFYISHIKTTWEQAVKQCIDMGTGIYLAEPVNFFILAQHNDNTWESSKRGERAWVGATGKKSDGWKWNSGKVIERDSNLWSKDQPNHDSTSRACGYLLKGELADWTCNTDYNYVCQKPL